MGQRAKYTPYVPAGVMSRASAAALVSLALVGLGACGDERSANPTFAPGAHTPARTAACLRERGWSVSSVRPLNLLNVNIPLEVEPRGWIQQLTLEFYFTVADARQRVKDLIQQGVSRDERPRIDNVVYYRPPHVVESRVFADIVSCIRLS